MPPAPGPPQRARASGLPAHGEAAATAFIDSALADVLGADRDRYAGRHTLVIGAGHSAANTLLALAQLADDEPGTTVSWAIRTGTPARTYGGEQADALPARGALGSRVHTLGRQWTDHPAPRLLRRPHRHRRRHGHRHRPQRPALTVDRIVSATGFRPDHTIAAELRLDLDPIMGSTRALAPFIDPNEHSCGTVPPRRRRTRPPRDRLLRRRRQVLRRGTHIPDGHRLRTSPLRRRRLDGDWDAARQVQLGLPETGVCSSTNALGKTPTVAAAAAHPPTSPHHTDSPPASPAACCPYPSSTPRPQRPPASGGCCGSSTRQHPGRRPSAGRRPCFTHPSAAARRIGHHPPRLRRRYIGRPARLGERYDTNAYAAISGAAAPPLNAAKAGAPFGAAAIAASSAGYTTVMAAVAGTCTVPACALLAASRPAAGPGRGSKAAHD